MRPEQLDFGWHLARIGAMQAAAAAEAFCPGWNDRAFAAFRRFCSPRGSRFTTAQVRTTSPDVPEPPDGRAWGAVAMRAHESGLVRRVSFVYSATDTAHAAPVSLWEAQ